jgi:hypothetical protein
MFIKPESYRGPLIEVQARVSTAAIRGPGARPSGLVITHNFPVMGDFYSQLIL